MEILTTLRSEVNIEETWDLSPLFENDAAFYGNLKETVSKVHAFSQQYKGTLNNSETVEAMLNDYAQITEAIDRLGNYASLNLSVDQTNAEAQKLIGQFEQPMMRWQVPCHS